MVMLRCLKFRLYVLFIVFSPPYRHRFHHLPVMNTLEKVVFC